jgi:DnaK suppressor protein
MDAERARELLAGERRRIEDSIGALERERSGSIESAADEPSGEEQHPADEATDVYEQERDEGMLEDLRRELEAVERAEARVADGTYGVSVESGQRIPDERLEAMPTAERTVEEEARVRRDA